MINLLRETEEKLNEYGKNWDDVVWVGTPKGFIPIERFKELADVEYYDWYGCPEVATDLLVVGKGFYMYSDEYDGAEWWEFVDLSILKKPENEIEAKTLVGGMWNTLEELQEEEQW